MNGMRYGRWPTIAFLGMAATLAIHIKGLGEIEYEVLRKVSDHFMSIPSVALGEVLRILDEVGFVRLVEKGRKIERIIPNIPVFEDVYAGLGDYAGAECDLNSHEQATLHILAALQKAPENKDKLFNGLGIEKPLFDRCIKIGAASGILSEHRARGRGHAAPSGPLICC